MRQVSLFSEPAVTTRKILLLMLWIFSSFTIHGMPIFAQPTESLQATYYDTHNRYTAAGAAFSGNVILSELVAIVDDHQKMTVYTYHMDDLESILLSHQNIM